MTTQDAAPVADQPIRPTCFHWLKNDKDDYGFALKDGRYALYPADMKLYSAPPDSLAVAQALEKAANVFGSALVVVLILMQVQTAIGSGNAEN